MQKKLTISIDEQLYYGLHEFIGKRKISSFIESLIKPHLIESDLERGYLAMALDENREKEAYEWSESTIGDIADETR